MVSAKKLLLAGVVAWVGCSNETLPEPTGTPRTYTAECTVVDEGCTLTQGYWKNHPADWPVDSLSLGATAYTKAQLLAILKTPVKGNGLIALSHQLIAAKLNVASGAGGSIGGAIAAADALIGTRVVPPVGSGFLATGATSGLTGTLDAYNNGDTGPGHCDDGPPPPPPPCCGDGIVDAGEECDDGNPTSGDGCSSCQLDPRCGDGTLDAGEQCDDGNTANGDGCSSTCTNEPPPPRCGDGNIDENELCDDGNTVDGDGCSSSCEIEPPPPCCGDGTVDAGEACDDGNTVDGDGCSSSCEIEPPPPCCGDGVVGAGEACDDGNTVDGDGCSSTCTIEPVCEEG